VVVVLTVLAGFGVQILPLIAGAGIFGVAIRFGSQTLVKDILSGVFFMINDAFRVGEYIQSGSYKGTVESFSLRSVRLRHHRGAIFTVPFGSLGAIQNESRDWVIDLMTINITYDSDVDLTRRLIKKVGQELASDPEFANDTLQPLKMQGIDSFGDFAIVLRLKLMTKPGAQFAIKRKAFLMIKTAFDENGVKIAVPTVHVESGSESAAAAQTTLKRATSRRRARLHVDFHSELTRVFHRELTRIRIKLRWSCLGQGMFAFLPLAVGGCGDCAEAETVISGFQDVAAMGVPIE
tara:strand:- start:255 stop:1133 length:879 start_codon:yes stop_codon:yes gene_type:complete